MPTHLLLIDCPDEQGLVYRITGELYRHGFNIISNHEFVDASTGHFFMRTAFAGQALPDDVINQLRETLPSSAMIRLASAEKRPIVIMATKEPHCLGDLLLRHAYDELPARICAVISNYETLAPLVQKFDIPFHHVSHHEREREQHEQEVLNILDQYAPDYLVLAKYMRVLTPQFVGRYPKRIINIHHSFLPAFMGASPYRQAFERGVKIIGATAHFVTDDLDTGPILVQDILHVDHSYSAADMARAGHDVEKIVLSKALKLVLEERVFLHNNRTIIFE
jgi:formyltetrahydrofolate deformylase